VLRSAVGTLHGIPHLEYLCIQFIPAPSPSHTAEWAAFWRFVATHPPLRCLGMEDLGDWGACPVALLLDTVLVLKHRRPELRLRRFGGRGQSRFGAEMLNCTDIPGDL